LDLLTACLSPDYHELHLDFANKDFFSQLKYDFLKENIDEDELRLWDKFFCSIVSFLVSLFEINNPPTNVSICEDLEFEKLLLEFLVHNKQKPEVFLL
jgi:hypothetical protein